MRQNVVQMRDIIKAILFTGVLIAARPGFAIEQELQISLYPISIIQ